ncbi:hypothetical protein LCGC14_0552370 [marine sediment metagenome]|uniref:Uncharacterized protein n=1 Tax=marine sediment metagenome TaxID=412755 RepID=A0A0F9RUK7_9ZZZZ
MKKRKKKLVRKLPKETWFIQRLRREAMALFSSRIIALDARTVETVKRTDGLVLHLAQMEAAHGRLAENLVGLQAIVMALKERYDKEHQTQP